MSLKIDSSALYVGRYKWAAIYEPEGPRLNSVRRIVGRRGPNGLCLCRDEMFTTSDETARKTNPAQKIRGLLPGPTSLEAEGQRKYE